MIICPNCNHQNPDGAVQCEACYTPLPQKAACPACGATVQSDASFCGQCGADMRARAAKPASNPTNSELNSSVAIPDLLPPDPLVMPEPITSQPLAQASEPLAAEGEFPLEISPSHQAPVAEISIANLSKVSSPEENGVDVSGVDASGVGVSGTDVGEVQSQATVDPMLKTVIEPESEVLTASITTPQTQLQRNTARLLHIQTDAVIELASTLSVIRLGKPNDRVPPDIDISGFPDSEIVSRVHANIRAEGDVYYIEDVGSSNGTYVNNLPLPQGNRHRLRPGDRIALGKGDKVSFIFQLA